MRMSEPVASSANLWDGDPRLSSVVAVTKVKPAPIVCRGIQQPSFPPLFSLAVLFRLHEGAIFRETPDDARIACHPRPFLEAYP